MKYHPLSSLKGGDKETQKRVLAVATRKVQKLGAGRGRKGGGVLEEGGKKRDASLELFE